MICIKCGKDLPIQDFPLRDKNKNVYRKECKKCNQALQKKVYDRNNNYIFQWKSQGCAKCGEKRHYVIDAHHVNPKEKDKNLSRLRVNCSIDRIQQELNKCIPFCSNCHREFHWLEQTTGITLEEYLK